MGKQCGHMLIEIIIVFAIIAIFITTSTVSYNNATTKISTLTMLQNTA